MVLLLTQEGLGIGFLKTRPQLGLLPRTRDKMVAVFVLFITMSCRGGKGGGGGIKLSAEYLDQRPAQQTGKLEGSDE